MVAFAIDGEHEVPIMTVRVGVRSVPIGAKVYAKDGVLLGTVADIRGRFFEVVGRERYWLPLAIVETNRRIVGVGIRHDDLGDFQVPDAGAA
jgi:hypothetical protein